MAIADKARELLKAPAAILLAAAALAAGLLALGVWLGLFSALIHSRWFPEILVVLAVIVFLLILFVGRPWYREHVFVKRLGSGYRVAGEQSPQELQAKFSAAFRRFRALPQHAGKGDPTYSLPWFLIIGPGESGKTEAIRAAGTFSSLTSSPSEGGTQNFDWWVSNSMLLLDTAGRYTIPADVERDRGEWYRLLTLIKYYHGGEPLSGMVVAVAADYLGSQPDEKLRGDAAHMRERIEDTVSVLGVDFPVYILVTKCDTVEGFAEFIGALPVRVLNEAVGWVDEPPGGSAGGPPRGRDAVKRLQDGLNITYQRLSTHGISILNGKVAEGLRQPLFCFPEEFRALSARLGTFLEVLAGEDVRYHTPLVRGMFISSARQQGPRYSFVRTRVGVASQPGTSDGKNPVRCFFRDLFETVLPRDRALASAAASKAT